MKKLFALVAVALTLCGLLTACGSKTETANDVDLTGFYNALAEQYGWGDDMMDLDGEMLEMYYPGLGDIPAKQLLAKAPVMSYAVSEYVFLQVDSEQDAAQAAKILQTRIDSQADGDAFYPETIDQWKAAKVLQNGAYVAMIASGEHQTEIEDAWNAQFGAYQSDAERPAVTPRLVCYIETEKTLHFNAIKAELLYRKRR